MVEKHDLGNKLQKEWKGSSRTLWNQVGVFGLYVLKFVFLCHFSSQQSIIVGPNCIGPRLFKPSSKSFGIQWSTIRIGHPSHGIPKASSHLLAF